MIITERMRNLADILTEEAKKFAIMNKDGNLYCGKGEWCKDESKAKTYSSKKDAMEKIEKLKEDANADTRNLEVIEI